MRGDFAMFITHDKNTNNYYLEMYRFDIKNRNVDKEHLFESKN